jgi:hypothetical protein
MRKAVSVGFLLLLAVPVVSGEDALPVANGPGMARLLPQQDALTAKGLTELFKTPSEAVTTKSGMLIAEPTPDVLMARLNDQGKVETECVASLDAAARFLAAARANDASRTAPEK